MDVLYVKYVNIYNIMEIVIFQYEWDEIENLKRYEKQKFWNRKKSDYRRTQP